jgi:hypothetical protein
VILEIGCEGLSESLGDLGNLADHLGFKDLANRLHNLLTEIRAGAEDLYKAWSDEFHNHCDLVEANTVNVVKTALSGMSRLRRQQHILRTSMYPAWFYHVCRRIFRGIRFLFRDIADRTSWEYESCDRCGRGFRIAWQTTDSK